MVSLFSKKKVKSLKQSADDKITQNAKNLNWIYGGQKAPLSTKLKQFLFLPSIEENRSWRQLTEAVLGAIVNNNLFLVNLFHNSHYNLHTGLADALGDFWKLKVLSLLRIVYFIRIT